jgi:hypothetical protein
MVGPHQSPLQSLESPGRWPSPCLWEHRAIEGPLGVGSSWEPPFRQRR